MQEIWRARGRGPDKALSPVFQLLHAFPLVIPMCLQGSKLPGGSMMSSRGRMHKAISSGMGVPPVVIPAYVVPRGAGQTGPRIGVLG